MCTRLVGCANPPGSRARGTNKRGRPRLFIGPVYWYNGTCGPNPPAPRPHHPRRKHRDGCRASLPKPGEKRHLVGVPRVLAPPRLRLGVVLLLTAPRANHPDEHVAVLFAHGHVVACENQRVAIVVIRLGATPGWPGSSSVSSVYPMVTSRSKSSPCHLGRPPSSFAAVGYAAATAAALLRAIWAATPALATSSTLSFFSFGPSPTSSEAPASASSNLFWVRVATAGCSSASA